MKVVVFVFVILPFLCIMGVIFLVDSPIDPAQTFEGWVALPVYIKLIVHVPKGTMPWYGLMLCKYCPSISEGTILQQKSLSRHVPAGTCTISFIIAKNANIYVNGLNSCKILKQWWGYTHLWHIVVIIGKRWLMWWKRKEQWQHTHWSCQALMCGGGI